MQYDIKHLRRVAMVCREQTAQGIKPPCLPGHCAACDSLKRDLCPNCEGHGHAYHPFHPPTRCDSCDGRGWIPKTRRTNKKED